MVAPLTYDIQLEWLTAVPWSASSTSVKTTSAEAIRDRAFLTNARKQLDTDHYGLEKIKKRLIEYLAVVRLKELQASREPTNQTGPRKSAKGPILL